jgi:hypothetical protein
MVGSGGSDERGRFIANPAYILRFRIQISFMGDKKQQSREAG